MAGLIVLEGIDGCGKSTVAKAVADMLGPKAVLTREPTDSWIGKAVRKGEEKEISPYTDALLFMADRAQHTLEMSGLIAKGKTVVTDRYYHSTVAYQTASLRRRSLGDNFRWLLEANMRISIRPDVTFVLIVDPETAIERVGRRSELSRFEKLDFLKEVQRNYKRLARTQKDMVLIDADRSLAEVTGDVTARVKERKV
jgi:dTMP kinase